MEQIHHLNESLKRLKLPGMMNNLELRLKQAHENNLGHLEFFSFLVQDEIVNREGNNLEKRIRSAGFGIEKTFEGFDYRFNEASLPSSLIRDLATCRFAEQKQNLVIAGPPGIGKTHIVKAIGHEMCRRGYDVLFKKTNQLLIALTAPSVRGDRLLKRCIGVDALILDDFALRRLDQKESEALYAIVDERLGIRTTLVTSNRPPQDWYGAFPDQVIGGAILDRLISGAVKIIVTNQAPSYRKEMGVSMQNMLDSNEEEK
ncbi:MAG: IS21-like element helper ATPase IstB [Deltaproteobacteria bacterium]|nr:IS21-like element helper ATPase IstB [Deltaproteobacteria bacterium]